MNYLNSSQMSNNPKNAVKPKLNDDQSSYSLPSSLLHDASKKNYQQRESMFFDDQSDEHKSQFQRQSKSDGLQNLRSPVWQYYHLDLERERAVCQLCNYVAKHRRSDPTTALRRHLTRVHSFRQIDHENKADSLNSKIFTAQDQQPTYNLSSEFLPMASQFRSPSLSGFPAVPDKITTRMRSGRSKAWEVFEKDPVEENQIVCRLCGVRKTFTGTTTNMLRHIDKFHPGEIPARAHQQAALRSQNSRNKMQQPLQKRKNGRKGKLQDQYSNRHGNWESQGADSEDDQLWQQYFQYHNHYKLNPSAYPDNTHSRHGFESSRVQDNLHQNFDLLGGTTLSRSQITNYLRLIQQKYGTEVIGIMKQQQQCIGHIILTPKMKREGRQNECLSFWHWMPNQKTPEQDLNSQIPKQVPKSEKQCEGQEIMDCLNFSLLHVMTQNSGSNPVILAVTIIYEQQDKKRSSDSAIFRGIFETLNCSLSNWPTLVYCGPQWLKLKLQNYLASEIKTEKNGGQFIHLHPHYFINGVSRNLAQIIQDRVLASQCERCEGSEHDSFIGFSLTPSFFRKIQSLIPYHKKLQASQFTNFFTQFLDNQAAYQQDIDHSSKLSSTLKLLEVEKMCEYVLGPNIFNALRSSLREEVLLRFCYICLYAYYSLGCQKQEKLVYKVRHRPSMLDSIWSNNLSYTVKYDVLDRMWKCCCKLFSAVGLPCPHMLRIIMLEGISPLLYIRNFWLRGSPYTEQVSPQSIELWASQVDSGQQEDWSITRLSYEQFLYLLWS